MKFTTETLRAALTTAIETSKTRHAQREAKDRREFDDKAAKHHERFGQAWLDAIPDIRKAVKAGRPITRDLLPQTGERSWPSPATFDATPPTSYVWQMPIELRTLENALNLIEDDEVSFNQLKELGVRVTVLRTLWELARVEKSQPVPDGR